MTVTYALTASLLFLGLTLMLVDVSQKLKKSEHLAISLVLIGTSMFYVAMDCLWIVVYTGETFHRGLFILLNFLFYLVYITLPYIWFLFSKHFAGGRMTGRTWNLLFAAPWFFNLALVVLTMLGTGFLWEIGDAASRYTRGPLFGIFSNLNLVYYFIPVIGIISLLISGKGADRRTLVTTLGFSVIPALGVFIYTYWISVDAIYPFQPCCFFLGVMFAYILLLSQVHRQTQEENLRLTEEARAAEIERIRQAEAESRRKQGELEEKLALQEKLLQEERQREQQDRMITALSSDYWSVYYLDLDTDEGVCYRSHEDLDGTGFKVGEHFPYLASVTRYGKQYVTEPYLEDFLRFIRTEAVLDGLRQSPVISHTYMVNRHGTDSYETVRFAAMWNPEDPEEKTAHHVSACFADTDAETRRAMEQNETLAEALTAAEEANKAKTTFLSNMSHEMRTPMNAIIGLDNIALNDPALPDTTRVHLEKIGTSAHHLLGIINDILDMSRIEAGRMVIRTEEFSFPHMLSQINTIIGGQCRDKGLHYDCRLLGEVSDYYIGDDMKLRQVMINILGNAVKFTPEGGSVTFTVEETARYDGKSTMRFVISDTGIGMSQDYLPKIFDAFSQEDSSSTNKYGSTGLGLPITRSIVELMNGHIEVASEKGVGSTFTVTVTLGDSDRRTGSEADRAGDIWPHDLCVLVIDDDPIACEHAQVVLSQVGINCEEVSSGAEGVRMVSLRHARRDPYDLILIDLRMPEMDGVETARQIREAVGDETPVIILTSYTWEDIEEEARAAGVDAFLAKPLFAGRVMEEFRDAFNKKNEQLARRTADLKGKRVLLAEDVAINAEIMMMVLSMREMEVDHAENGRAAVDKYMEHAPGYYDVILMDMRMPEMDGLEASRAIRAAGREDSMTIPIIALTANAFDEDVQRSMQAGLNAHLSKPVEPETLYMTLEEHLAESAAEKEEKE